LSDDSSFNLKTKSADGKEKSTTFKGKEFFEFDHKQKGTKVDKVADKHNNVSGLDDVYEAEVHLNKHADYDECERGRALYLFMCVEHEYDNNLKTGFNDSGKLKGLPQIGDYYLKKFAELNPNYKENSPWTDWKNMTQNLQRQLETWKYLGVNAASYCSQYRKIYTPYHDYNLEHPDNKDVKLSDDGKGYVREGAAKKPQAIAATEQAAL